MTQEFSDSTFRDNSRNVCDVSRNLRPIDVEVDPSNKLIASSTANTLLSFFKSQQLNCL
jgi:hypothetical protein